MIKLFIMFFFIPLGFAFLGFMLGRSAERKEREAEQRPVGCENCELVDSLHNKNKELKRQLALARKDNEDTCLLLFKAEDELDALKVKLKAHRVSFKETNNHAEFCFGERVKDENPDNGNQVGV